MSTAMSIATASAFNVGLLGFQIRRTNRSPQEKTFFRGERCAYHKTALVILRRLDPLDRKTIRDALRDGWRAARDQFKPSHNKKA